MNSYQSSINSYITYSGKAIPQLKLPNSTNIENMDTGLVSNDAAGRNEANNLEIKVF